MYSIVCIPHEIRKSWPNSYIYMNSPGALHCKFLSRYIDTTMHILLKLILHKLFLAMLIIIDNLSSTAVTNLNRNTLTNPVKTAKSETHLATAVSIVCSRLEGNNIFLRLTW